jgi:hypothetical protein
VEKETKEEEKEKEEEKKKKEKKKKKTTMTMTTVELVSEFHACCSNVSCPVVLRTLQKGYRVLTPMFLEIYSVELPKM